MPTIPKSHLINQTSENDLKNRFPLTHFIVRTLAPDYHIDFIVEIVEKNEPTGINFFVQLKGIEKIRLKNGFIKGTMKTKHLQYYLDKIQNEPLFLLVSDVSRNKMYWLFIQKYLKETISNKNWRKQQNVTISINIDNEINNLEAFQKVVKEANDYIKSTWPTPIFSKIKSEIEAFKILDPRFNAKFVADNQNVAYKFHSNEKIDLQFYVKDKTVFEKIFTNDKGEEFIKIPSKEVEVTGSDLFKDRLSAADFLEIKLEPKKLDADVYLARYSLDQKGLVVVHLKSTLFLYKDKIIIESQLKDSPLEMRCVLYNLSDKPPLFNMTFNFSNWNDRPIKFLPYADKLVSLLTSYTDNEALNYKAEFNGEVILDGTLKIQDNNQINNYTYSILDLYTKLIYLDNFYNLNLKFPDLSKLKREAFNDIYELYALLKYKVCRVKEKNITADLEVKNNREKLAPFLNSQKIRFLVNVDFKLLDKIITFKELYIEITNPKYKQSRSELNKLLASNQEYIFITIMTTKKSVVHYHVDA